jgi:acyl-CoA synthetase (AMP-forming)/AMP-acid ligase II
MYHRNLKLLVFLITPFLAVVIIFLPIIPTWEDAKFVFSIIIWLLSLIFGVFLFKKPQHLPLRKTRIAIVIYLLLSSALFLFVSFIVLISSAFDAPSIQTVASRDNSTTVYLYNYTCSPPDTSTGCGTYHGELKFRIGFTPFVNTKFNCSCLFGSPERVGEWVTIPLEANRDQTSSSIKINLSTGEIVQD